MRLFTAIDIPEGVRGNLSVLLERLRPKAKLSWTTLEKMHITTKFIGEWPQERLDEMKGTLARVTAPGEIEIAVRGLGWFPNSHNPRVLWAGVDGGAALPSLAAAIDREVSAIGVPAEDRQYSPHLTLARIRNRVPLGALKAEVEGVESMELGCFKPTEFYLYLSHAGRYDKLAGFPLR